MKAAVLLGSAILMMSILARADDIPNGKDVLVKENAINMPAGRILLARRGTEYCAVQFLSSTWSKEESYSKYIAYYVADPATSFSAAGVKPEEGEVYEKEPLSIIGRFALSRSRDAVFCDKMTLKWSGGPNATAWIYFDEDKTLELAPTTWRDIRDVNAKDPNLKWFKYGDVGSQPRRLD